MSLLSLCRNGAAAMGTNDQAEERKGVLPVLIGLALVRQDFLNPVKKLLRDQGLMLALVILAQMLLRLAQHDQIS